MNHVKILNNHKNYNKVKWKLKQILNIAKINNKVIKNNKV